MPWGRGRGIKSSPVQSDPVREVNECTISNASKADITGAQREIERKTSDLEKEGKNHTTEAVCGRYRTRRGGLIYR